MSEPIWIAVLTFVVGPVVVVLVKSLSDYLTRRSADKPVTTSEAATAVAVRAVADAGSPAVTQEVFAATIRAMRVDMEEALTEQRADHEREMGTVHGELRVVRAELVSMRRLHTIAIRYAGQLREDIARAGHEPRGWPDELTNTKE